MKNRTILKAIREDLNSAIRKRFNRGDRIAFVLQLGCVSIGSALSVIAQFQMSNSTDNQFEWRYLGIFGAVLACIGGALFWILERDSTEELKIAFKASEAANEIEQTQQLERENFKQLFEEVRVANDSRERLAIAVSAGISIVDEVIATKLLNEKDDVEKILTAALTALPIGLGLKIEDDYCISVFQRQTVDDVERMVRFAERRSGENQIPNPQSRSWARGEGFTGHAWKTEAPVLIDDSGLEHWRSMILGITDDDVVKYRSVACFLIRPGPKEGKVWGALTVTTSKANCFGPSSKSLGIARGDAVRSIANIIAILVAAKYDV
jgi:hypothetical protein